MFNIQWIENAWPVIKASATARLGAALGIYGAILAAAQTFLPQSDQDAMHIAWHVQHLPFVLAVAGIFGIPVARGIKQQSVTDAANK